MKRFLLTVLVMGLASVLAACGPTAQQEQQTQVDEAIHKIERGVSAYYLLGPDASADQVRSTTTALSGAWDELEAAAEGLEGMHLDEAAAAHQALVSTVEALPVDGEARPMDSVMPKVEAFKATIEEVHAGGHFHE